MQKIAQKNNEWEKVITKFLKTKFLIFSLLTEDYKQLFSQNVSKTIANISQYKFLK